MVKLQNGLTLRPFSSSDVAQDWVPMMLLFSKIVIEVAGFRNGSDVAVRSRRESPWRRCERGRAIEIVSSARMPAIGSKGMGALPVLRK